jgi:hypothetical protein
MNPVRVLEVSIADKLQSSQIYEVKVALSSSDLHVPPHLDLLSIIRDVGISMPKPPILPAHADASSWMKMVA